MSACSDLDGRPSEAAQLFDVLSLLADDGSNRLGRDVHMDRLLLLSLNTHTRRDAHVHTHIYRHKYTHIHTNTHGQTYTHVYRQTHTKCDH